MDSGLVAVPGIHFYYVQEMIAALIIFSFVFVVVAAFVLIIFLLDRASQHVITWAEAGVARVLHRVVDAVEGVTAGPGCAASFPKGTNEGEREELNAVYLRSPSVEGVSSLSGSGPSERRVIQF